MKNGNLFLAFIIGFISCLIISLFVQYFCTRDNYSNRENKTNISEKLESKKEFNMQYLDTKEKYLAEIASFTAVGAIEKLEKSFNEALDNGLTINEIKEALLHTYAYVGFPRSLNGMGALQRVLEKRVADGIEDIEGEKPTEVSNIDKFVEGGNVQTGLVGMAFNYTFVPGMDAFLKEHLFADLFLRGVLTYKERELVTIATLTTVNGGESQLSSHIRMGMNTGLTIEQIKEVVNYVGTNLNFDKSEVLKNFE